MPAAIDKNRPSEDWIAELNRRHPVERTVAEALDNKLRVRRGPEYHCKQAGEIGAALNAFLARRVDGDFEIRDLRRLPGGGSKEQFLFDLHQDGGSRRMILRMNPGHSLVETHRSREFQLLQAFQAVVPVPQVYWLDHDGSELGQPAFVCAFVAGQTQPPEKGKANAVGVDYGAGDRGRLGEQFVDILARIHRFDWRSAELSAFDVPAVGTTQAVDWKIGWWERVYEEDCLEEHPMVPRALAWLKHNKPAADDICVVHGDFRSGNFLYNPDSLAITAMLDWELGHLGDPHDDLSWIMMRGWGHYDEAGEFLYCGMLGREELVAGYEAKTGMRVDPAKLAYYQILNTLKLGIIGFATGPRAAHVGQSHQDVIVNLLTAVGYVCFDDLTRLLPED